MLLVVVGLFATLWFPYRFLVVYNSFATHRYMELCFLMFCKTMIFINSAINPFSTIPMSIKFRKAFKRLLSCDSSRSSLHFCRLWLSKRVGQTLLCRSSTFTG
ncbi:thyroliberin receptor [Caerostris extrusa]|uniref:Thyroliberin receptor n=1 Tax=Caerostris extrusa TaxID=172846 RepID=A0AAV4U869_CAEEX|nr:thyroliberin receptor [Caerostris extrusa]